MISKTNEYALRVMVFLAAQQAQPAGTRRIAEATQVPASYLAKILLTLVRQQLVRSRRGLHGGFTLARDPATINIYDIITAVDPLPRIHACPLGLRAHARLCPLHRELDSASEVVERAFRRATLAGLAAAEPNVPLCDNKAKTQRRRRSRSRS